MRTVKIRRVGVICHSFITSSKRLLTFLALFLPFLRWRGSVSKAIRYFQNNNFRLRLKTISPLLFVITPSLRINLYFAHAGLSRRQGRQGNLIHYNFSNNVTCICFLPFVCRSKSKQRKKVQQALEKKQTGVSASLTRYFKTPSWLQLIGLCAD